MSMLNIYHLYNQEDVKITIQYNKQEEVHHLIHKEQLHKLYAYWTPTNNLAISAQFIYDLYEADLGEFTSQGGDIPEEVTTQSLPISITYFGTSKFYVTTNKFCIY